MSGGNLTFSFNPWDQITSPYYCNIDCVWDRRRCRSRVITSNNHIVTICPRQHSSSNSTTCLLPLVAFPAGRSLDHQGCEEDNAEAPDAAPEAENSWNVCWELQWWQWWLLTNWPPAIAMISLYGQSDCPRPTVMLRSGPGSITTWHCPHIRYMY